jgi:ASC-1-like (ASCH) protein
MKVKSFLAKPFASYVHRQVKKDIANALADQQKIFQDLLKTGAKTIFGTDHRLAEVKTYEAFRDAIPVRDYEQFKPYIEQIKEGKHNVLWRGQPIYLAKTSGTTSGIKYIPITGDSIDNHINTARNAITSLRMVK